MKLDQVPPNLNKIVVIMIMFVIVLSACQPIKIRLRDDVVTASPPAASIHEIALPMLLFNQPTSPIATPTSPAPIVPTVEPTAVLNPQVTTYETTITLSTYPYAAYLEERLDPTYNMSVFYFNRAAFEAAAPTPSPMDYTAIVMENPYLKLVFIPELGGRLYSAIIKATGQEVFYHNPVVKPSRYGLLQPIEANWWLATGGLEWAYPTQEHGYRWGVPWTYDISRDARGATITLSDQAAGRVGVSVDVRLDADSALFSVTPTLINDGQDAVPIQFWTNAVLSLSTGTMSPNTQFVMPVDEIIVHSRGAEGWTMPEAQMPAPWPSAGGVDLQKYDQWASYLGFFIPDLDAPFMGAYNANNDLGIARLIVPGSVPGNKVFGFSLNFPYRDYTDDNSQYFELWGGANTEFWPKDDILVAPGESLGWQEQWWPLAGLGGLSWANDQAAIHLTPSGGSYLLTTLVSRQTDGIISVSSDGKVIFEAPFTARPSVPLHWQFESSNSLLTVSITDDRGKMLLTYNSPR